MDQKISRVEELKLVLDHARHRVTRGHRSVDIGGKCLFWDILSELAKRYDAYHSVADLKYAVCGNYPTSDGTVYSAVSDLRTILRPLGIGIYHENRLGYVLYDLNA